ncbi:hypothetical protein EXIGLDRAFT_783050 [Exidia glandulosa HHB12029]|uniref:Uncharacterized protein n=1 Tax=Exidia glandulosa HHB12029 TaxID=1314781 RepID=A0A166NAB2_EXIGL|nr:hypothetical protein EXIGLDRAFT_783050 [Exidia glandulosa HHB12029]
MAANLQRIKGLVGAHPAPTPAPTTTAAAVPTAAAPSGGKHAAQAANPNSYAGRTAKQAVAASAAPSRLILSVHATPELAAHIRSDAKRLRDDVNKSLGGWQTKRTPAAPLRIAGMDTTVSGNIVIYAADGLTSENWLPHADKIAGAIVLVNGVPTYVHAIEGLPSDKELLDEIVNYNSHKYEWACMPRWLGRPADVQMHPRGCVILAFLNAADAAHAIQHSVTVFGNFCSARRFEDVPQSAHAITSQITLAASASAKCAAVSAALTSTPLHLTSARTSPAISTLSGAHVVRDAQCKVWQSRRNALRKPQHTAAKTGGRIRRTQSRAALGTKDGRPVGGANALELGKANDAARKAAAASNRSTPPAEPAQVDSA